MEDKEVRVRLSIRRFQPLTEFLEKADLTPRQFLALYEKGEAPAVMMIEGDPKVMSGEAAAWFAQRELQAMLTQAEAKARALARQASNV